MGLFDVFNFKKIKADLNEMNEKLKKDANIEGSFTPEQKRKKFKMYEEEMKQIVINNIEI